MKNYTDLSIKFLKNDIKRTSITIIGVMLAVALIIAGSNLNDIINDLWLKTIQSDGDYYFYYTNLNEAEADLASNHVMIEKATKELASGKYNLYVKTRNTNDIHQTALKIAHDTGILTDKNFEKNITFNESYLSFYSQGSVQLIPYSWFEAIFDIVVMVPGFLLVFFSFNISVREKTEKLGVLRCLGATPKQVRKIINKEAQIITVLGIVLGIIAGILLSYLFYYELVTIGKSGYSLLIGIDKLAFSISINSIIRGIILGSLVVYISAFLPARIAGKVTPIEAIAGRRFYQSYNEGIITSKINKIGWAGKLLNKLTLSFEAKLAMKNMRRNKLKVGITIFSLAISMTLYIIGGYFLSGTEIITSSVEKSNVELSQLGPEVQIDKEVLKKAQILVLTINIFVYTFISIFSIIVIMNIFIIILKNISSKKRELSIIMAIGADAKQIFNIIYFEEFLCIVLGNVLGILIGSFVLFMSFHLGTQSTAVIFKFPWKTTLIVMLLLIISTMILAYFPVKKLQRENILENIKGIE